MKKCLLALLLLVFTLPIFAKNTILILGDSLSSGYGLADKQGWVSLLEKRLADEGYDYDVINSSVAGDTTGNGRNRLAKLLEEYVPNITIVELGGNDGLRGIQLETIRNNLQEIITLAKESGSSIIVVGVRLPPNFGSDYIDQFHAIYENLAQKNNISLVPFFLKGVDDTPKLMQDDRIHPTGEAQTILLENVWPELKKMLH